MMKRSLKLGAVCLGMAVLLCACGKGSTESTEAASSETETAQSEAVSETVAETEDTNVYPYEYDVESMVKLGEYKGLTYTETDVSVSDDDDEKNIKMRNVKQQQNRLLIGQLKMVIQLILILKARLMVRHLMAVQPQVHP